MIGKGLDNWLTQAEPTVYGMDEIHEDPDTITDDLMIEQAEREAENENS